MPALQPSEVLFIPKRRRLVHNTLQSPAGQEELHVFYGDKQIVFDEPDLLAFGNRLLRSANFRAEEAMAWADGEPYAWERVQALLEALLEHEIVKRVADSAPERNIAVAFPATLGTAQANPQPQTFSAHHDMCPAITKEVFGHAIELGNLEAVVPVYRIAHPVLDQDGRQVGENNVTPRPLFLDLPTQRRQCNYPGSRFQSPLPMNVTALRHMTTRWPELLSLTEQFRSAMLARWNADPTALRVGDAHLLAVGCLASVGYVMLRSHDPVPNGRLDAGLAGMFRLVDGVRLVTTDMMRAAPLQHGCELAINARRVAEYAEQNAVYTGLYGVCAGPQALIDEYLRVLLDGAPAPIAAEPDLGSRLGDLDAALDYGLYGQRIEALIRSFGAAQALLHTRLQAAASDCPAASRLAQLLQQPVDARHYPLLRETHPLQQTMELEIGIDQWLLARTSAALPRPVANEHHGSAADSSLDASAQQSHHHQLAAFFSQLLQGPEPATQRFCDALAGVAAEVFALERNCLRAVQSEQQRLNAALQRPPGPPLTGAELALYTRSRCGPPLESTLREGLGLDITADATRTVLTHRGHSLALVLST